MPSLNGLRGRLLLQAAGTAVYALAGRSSTSGWAVPTVVVAVGAVFVALAMRPEPTWRRAVTGYEVVAVAFGLVALVSAHYVPGTLLAGHTLYVVLRHGGAAFAGAPAWDASSLPLPAPAAYPVAPSAPEPAAPVAVVVPAAAALPTQAAPVPVAVPAPRPVAMTVLPGR